MGLFSFWSNLTAPITAPRVKEITPQYQCSWLDRERPATSASRHVKRVNSASALPTLSTEERPPSRESTWTARRKSRSFKLSRRKSEGGLRKRASFRSKKAATEDEVPDVPALPSTLSRQNSQFLGSTSTGYQVSVSAGDAVSAWLSGLPPESAASETTQPETARPQQPKLTEDSGLILAEEGVRLGTAITTNTPVATDVYELSAQPTPDQETEGDPFDVSGMLGSNPDDLVAPDKPRLKPASWFETRSKPKTSEGESRAVLPNTPTIESEYGAEDSTERVPLAPRLAKSRRVSLSETAIDPGIDQPILYSVKHAKVPEQPPPTWTTLPFADLALAIDVAGADLRRDSKQRSLKYRTSDSSSVARVSTLRRSIDEGSLLEAFPAVPGLVHDNVRTPESATFDSTVRDSTGSKPARALSRPGTSGSNIEQFGMVRLSASRNSTPKRSTTGSRKNASHTFDNSDNNVLQQPLSVHDDDADETNYLSLDQQRDYNNVTRLLNIRNSKSTVTGLGVFPEPDVATDEPRVVHGYSNAEALAALQFHLE